MARPKFVQIPPHQIDRFRDLLGDRYAAIEAAAERAREVFAGRAIWHVSSTMRGGGVAEMLHAFLPYVRGVGVDTRWVVLRERAEFFALTKRLHNHLHGVDGDGGPIGEEERELYEQTLNASAAHLSRLLQEQDIVFLHDPQTAGLAPAVKAVGPRIVWRCHIGADHPNDLTRRAWDFLTPYVGVADAYVFSRAAYVWDGIDRDRVSVMAPAIDPFLPKNEELDPATVERIIGVIGLGEKAPAQRPTFTRADGSPGRVERRAEITQEERLPDRARAVVQISRWDRLKDHLGVLTCFQRHLGDADLHLVLAGPATGSISDDPEGAAVWREVEAAWHELGADLRRRVHLVSVPMDDPDENAAIVNALQRRADIVVQKSIAEGFGLTVAEAMWKRRPVIGTRVGGIQDQIVDGESGILIDDPRDLGEVARAIRFLAEDRERAAEIGERARRRVLERFLVANRLVEYVEFLAQIDAPVVR
ncbi:MAG TPA: glycosyltransferase [Solirubrobacterales bacterium]